MSQTPFNPFDFLQTPWGKLPMSSPGLPGADINELEKRIAELKTVEQWLNLNLNLLRTSIQGLEIQRGTLAAISAFSQSFAPGSAKPPSAEPARSSTRKTLSSSETPASDSPSAGYDQAALWWNSMQEQFAQMLTAAQASAQTMAAASGGEAKDPAKTEDSSASKKARPDSARPDSASPKSREHAGPSSQTPPA